MRGEEIARRVEQIEDGCDDKRTQAICLLITTLNEINWSLTYLRKTMERMS